MTRIKLMGIALMLLLSVVLAILRSHSWHWLVCAALGFSWLGDAMLSHYPPIAGHTRDPFIAGMGFFALAQITYILAFSASLLGMTGLRMREPGAIVGIELIGGALPIFLLAGLLLWVMVALRSQRPWLLKIAVLLYAELVCAMAAYAFSAAFIGNAVIWPLLLGGPLFVISDGIIAAHIFQEKFANDKRYDFWIWVTYVPAQLCLLLGASMLY